MGENRGLAGQSWTPSPPQRLAGSPPCRPSNEIRGTGGGRQFGEGEKMANGKWPNRRHAHPIASLPLQLPVLCRSAACFALKNCPLLPPQRKKTKKPLRPSPVASDLVPRCQADPQGIHRIIASTRRKNKRLTRPRLQHPIHQSLRRAPRPFATNRRLLRPSICCSFAPLRITATAITVGDSSLCARVLCSTAACNALLLLLLHAARLCHQPASLTGSTVPFSTPNATTASLCRQTAKRRQDEEKTTTETPHPSQGSIPSPPPTDTIPRRPPSGGRATTTIQNPECGLVTSTTGRPSANYPVPRPIDY